MSREALRSPTEAALHCFVVPPTCNVLFDAHRLTPRRPQALYSDGVSPVQPQNAPQYGGAEGSDRCYGGRFHSVCGQRLSATKLR